jgi:hypothetical protein
MTGMPRARESLNRPLPAGNAPLTLRLAMADSAIVEAEPSAPVPDGLGQKFPFFSNHRRRTIVLA